MFWTPLVEHWSPSGEATMAVSATATRLALRMPRTVTATFGVVGASPAKYISRRSRWGVRRYQRVTLLRTWPPPATRAPAVPCHSPCSSRVPPGAFGRRRSDTSWGKLRASARAGLRAIRSDSRAARWPRSRRSRVGFAAAAGADNSPFSAATWLSRNWLRVICCAGSEAARHRKERARQVEGAKRVESIKRLIVAKRAQWHFFVTLARRRVWRPAAVLENCPTTRAIRLHYVL